MDHQNLFQCPGQKMPATPEGRGTVLTNCECLPDRCSVEETRNIQLREPFLMKASSSGIDQLHDESTKVLRQKRLTGVRTSGEMEEQMDLERKHWWQ